jgi:CheY-like chemotaxis protein
MAKRIFVVDDEVLIAETLARILRNSGYEADAGSALARCESCRPDLVISDVVMPGMNGAEMAVLIRDRYPACKILLFSGQAYSMDVLAAVGKQGYGFELLAKPIHPTDLLAKIAGLSNVAQVEPKAAPQPHLNGAGRVADALDGGESSSQQGQRPTSM